VTVTPGELSDTESLFQELNYSHLQKEAIQVKTTAVEPSSSIISVNNKQMQQEGQKNPVALPGKKKKNLKTLDARHHPSTHLQRASRSGQSVNGTMHEPCNVLKPNHSDTNAEHNSELDSSDTEAEHSLQAHIPDADEEYNLETRIRAAIAYTRSCFAADTQPEAFSDFKISLKSSPATLALIRNASSANIATFVYGNRHFECYSLGVPPAPRPFREPNPAWFMELSRAEMRAGPMRTEGDVRVAEREIQYQMRRREKSQKGANGKLRHERDVMIVGLQRQLLGLPMHGVIDDEVVEKAKREHGSNLENEEALFEEFATMVEQDEVVGEEDPAVSGDRKKRKRMREDAETDSGKTPKKRRCMAAKQPRRAAKKPRIRPAETSDSEWQPGDL
jgi:hypothetical protein